MSGATARADALPWSSALASRRVCETQVPSRFSSVEAEVRAIRRSAALSVLPHLLCHRISGAGAFDLVDRVCSSPLFLRDGQLRQTLLLDDDATVLADANVGLDDDGFLLVTDGATRESIAAHLELHRGEAEVVVEHLTETHTFLSLNGPFAWEVMAELEGPGIVGFPYLSFYRPSADRLCFRAGKTGEFGYDLLVPRHEASAVWSRLLELGRPFDVVAAGLDALWSCELEAWFFNVHREGRRGLSPVELSLRWRLAHDKPYVGSEAVARRLAEPKPSRISAIRAAEELCDSDPIELSGRVIGQVLVGAPSFTLGGWIGIALLEAEYAHSGIDRFTVNGRAIRTVSAPLVQNLSLVVNPLRHTYRDPGSIPVIAASGE